ncbi:MAG: class I SAM-dependent methyltransferase [Deltaproteobacteria bacterium]|nr:class I SAM-dependent methyltransferase [Deltaproteobacteria bacterium]MBW2042695.1 class I SAM-dependent methyltransferase [Deltaproteobacteria bacterium]MBW2133013.1 class I SAM-dependent methyltransferase [Deltaproteobacteria bacterium]
MILNCAERLVVNNPLRMAMQRLEMVWFLQAADLSPNPRILEIGCGRGAGARILLKKMHPRRIEALDLDPVMMHTAKGFLTSKERERISLLAGDSTRLPFHSASFDVVFGFGLLHHVPDWESAVKKWPGSSNPGDGTTWKSCTRRCT